MPINRGYIFNKVSFLLKKEMKFFTSSDVQITIGIDSFRRIAEDIEYPKSNYSGVVTSGVWIVPMPADFIKVDRAKDIVFADSTGIRKIRPQDQRNIGRDQVLSATPGSPENYFMEDQVTIGLYPPSTSGIIIVPYVSLPTSLSGDADANELTERCYMASVYWTVAECMLKDSDEKYAIYMTKYDKEIQRLRSNYGDMFDENKDFQPDQGYLQ